MSCLRSIEATLKEISVTWSKIINDNISKSKQLLSGRKPAILIFRYYRKNVKFDKVIATQFLNYFDPGCPADSIFLLST